MVNEMNSGNSGSEVRADVEILKEDLRDVGQNLSKIGDDVGAVVRDAVTEGKRMVTEHGRRISDAGSTAAVSATERFDELKVAASNTYRAVLDDVGTRIEAKPVGSIVTAFFAGFIVGRVMMRG